MPGSGGSAVRVARAVLAGLLLLGVDALAAPDAAQRAFARGDCSAALRSAQAAVAAADSTHGPRSPAALAALARLSTLALDCRRPDADGLDAALAREHALRLARSGAGSAAVAEVELRRVRRDALRNRIDAALQAAQALRDSPRYASWPPALRARVLGQLASLHNLRADAQSAFDAAVAAIDLVRTQAADEYATLLGALEDQGLALTRMRQGGKALAPLTEAEAIARTRFGAQRRERADALRFLAYAERDAGDFGRAIGAFEQALAIQRAQAEIDQAQVAVLELNLAQTLKVSGDGARALAHYEQALALDARAPDPAGRTRPAIVHGLANLYRDRNELERAVALYEQAVPLFAQVFGERSVQLAQVLNNYANAEGNRGRYDAAIALYERAVAIARERQSADPADYVPLANIAMLRVWQSRYAEAEAPFRESIARLRGVAAGSEGNVLFAQLGLAASLWGQGRLDEAFAAAEQAERLRQAGLRLAISHLGEEHAIGFEEYQRPTLDFVIAIAAASGKREHLQRAWELSLSGRDQVAAQVAQRVASARAAGDAKFAPLWQAWREASGALARAELAGDGAQRGAAQDALDRAERALAEAAAPLAASVEARPLAFAAVDRALDRGAALVLFATVQPHAASDFAKPEAEQGEPDLYALVLAHAGGAVRAIRLGSSVAAAQRIDAWIAALSDPGSALATVDARGRAVRELIWDPLANEFPGKRVLLIPTGALFRVPWPALPDARGFLVDGGWTIHALNHERELTAPPLAPTASLLAIADPAMPALLAPAAGACSAGQALPPLPGARREVEDLQALWRRRFGADAVQTFVGDAATEARVRRASAGAGVLHFATHSLAPGSGCAAASTRGFALVADAPAADGAAALTPAALALAAGDPARTDDDGLLGAGEIATLDLSRVHWAVLAACATAAGATHHYEGLSGLSRAFRLAGARTVIMSLWPVDDGATEQWSMALYRARFDDDLDTAAAMAAAQRAILSARRGRGESVHPYFWAGFVAAGDWR